MIVFKLLFQTVVLAIQQIWANKVRALLTMLAIIIAVSALVGTVGAVTGLKAFVLEQFASVGASKVWISPNRPRGQRDRYSFKQIAITTAQVDGILANCPSIARLSPVMNFSAPVQFGDEIKPFVPVSGIRPSWHEIEDRFVTVGRPFFEIDDAERRNVCLINDKGVAELGLNADPSGQYLLVGGRRFLVVGVVETKAVSPMFGGDEAQTEIFIPFRTGEIIRPDPRIYVIAQTTSPELFDDAKAEITFYMRRARNLGPDDPDTFRVDAIEEAIKQFNTIAAGITAAAAGIVGISLLVGGIGIMNIMLVSVSERTREIGLRKAVGARPEVVLLQFLVEAVTLCLVGGAVGLIVGQGMILILRAIPDSPMKGAEIPPWAVALAIAFSAGTGIVFGMFPAIKAARLDPIVALRHE